MPDGTVQDDTPAFIPQDPTTFQSEGAALFQGKIAANGTKKNDIGITGFFSPSPA